MTLVRLTLWLGAFFMLSLALPVQTPFYAVKSATKSAPVDHTPALSPDLAPDTDATAPELTTAQRQSLSAEAKPKHFSAWLDQLRQRCCSASYTLKQEEVIAHASWLEQIASEGMSRLREEADQGSPRAISLVNQVLSGRNESSLLFNYRLQIMAMLSPEEKSRFAQKMREQAQGEGSLNDAVLWAALHHYWQPGWQLNYASVLQLLEQQDALEESVDVYGVMTSIYEAVRQIDDLKLTTFSDVPLMTLEQVTYYHR